MAWAEFDAAVPVPDSGVLRYNAATGKNYIPIYGDGRHVGGDAGDWVYGAPTGYFSFDPSSNRENEGPYVIHDAAGNVTGRANFTKGPNIFKEFLMGTAALVAAGFGGAALLNATGGVTGTAGAIGNGAFLGEGVASGVAAWDGALATAGSAATAGAGAVGTVSSLGSTVSSIGSTLSGVLKPATALLTALTGAGGGGGSGDHYVPIDQGGSGSGGGTAAQINPLVWVAVAAGVVFLLMDN